MAEITAKLVSELRAQTGAGLMDCKKALQEANGDFERAKELLRIRGQTIAEKKAGRATREGIIYTLAADESSLGVILELDCETDFVARTQDFRDLAHKIANALSLSSFSTATQLISDMDALLAVPFDEKTTVRDLITDAVGRIGENIKLPRAAILKLDGKDCIISSYVHLDGKIGALVGLRIGSPELRNDERVREAGKNLCLQIVAEDPVAISIEEVPPHILEKERRVAREQTLAEGKPANIVDKIVEGRLNKFFRESVLLEQAFVKEEKQSVKAYLESVGKSLGTELAIEKFFRFEVGGA